METQSRGFNFILGTAAQEAAREVEKETGMEGRGVCPTLLWSSILGCHLLPGQLWAKAPWVSTQHLLFAVKQGHRSLAQAPVSVVSRLMVSGVLRSCFHVGVLRCVCTSESQRAWSEAHRRLRRTADPVCWLLFMPEETEARWGEWRKVTAEGHMGSRVSTQCCSPSV